VQLLKYIPLQLTCCLFLGILTGFYGNFNFSTVSIALLAIASILGICWLLAKSSNNFSVSYTILTFFVFFGIGVASITFHNDLNTKNHYTSFVLDDNPERAILKITSILKSNTYYDKYEASVLNINDIQVQGKILVNIKRDSTQKRLHIDDKLFVKTEFQSIQNPKNPYQFNYKKYLEKQHIYRQITVSSKAVFMLQSNKNSLKGYAHLLRVKINQGLQKNGFEGDELAIINALLLGQRQEMSKDLIENYSKAGALHILAVSGLHVGIILILITFLLKPFERFKNGKNIKLIITIFLLWTFAFIAGMSASVVRAVAMFTALSIGLAVNRKNSVYKNLIISLFFLLLFNPYYLFQVGFQLSYVAVFCIVWLQPIIARCWKPKWKFANYFWQLFTVSLAAQIGVLPLSIYYFHQFPGLFFVANLAIIPILGFVLAMGILIIILSLIGVTPSFLSTMYQKIIALMNQLISWVAQQESFLFQEISLSFILMLAVYILTVFSFRWIQHKTVHNLKYTLCAFILIQGIFIYEKYNARAINEFVVFNRSKASALAIKENGKIWLHKTRNFDKNETVLKSYKVGSANNGIHVIDSIKNIYEINAKKLLVVDSMGVYKLNLLKPEYVLLSQSPKINLERLISELNPKVIIADASNYKSYVKRWHQTCLNSNIRFHHTVQNGAFLEKY